MCWSGEASGVLAAVGVTATVVLARQKEPKELWIALGYFSAMELLQAFTYVWIDLCGNPSNTFLTSLGYLHIAFQPFFVNMVAMYFLPEPIKHRIQKYVYALCAVATAAILLKAFPLPAAGTCRFGVESFCGPMACSVSGSWHIAWQWPLNGLMSDPIPWVLGFGFGLHAFAYYLSVFALPILYGSWKLAGFHYVVGPFLAGLTTDDPNEWAAVWCLLSIALCLSVIKSPLRKRLRVRSWPLFGVITGSWRAPTGRLAGESRSQ